VWYLHILYKLVQVRLSSQHEGKIYDCCSSTFSLQTWFVFRKFKKSDLQKLREKCILQYCNKKKLQEVMT